MSQNIIRKRKKRFVAMLMVFAMIIGLMPHMSVEATDYTLQEMADNSTNPLLYSVVTVGDAVCFSPGGDGYAINYYDSDGTTISSVSPTDESITDVGEGIKKHTVIAYDGTKIPEGNFRGWYVYNLVFYSGGLSKLYLKAVSDQDGLIKYVFKTDTHDYSDPYTYQNDPANPPTYKKGKVTTIKPAISTSDVFVGWFDNSSFTGNIVNAIPATATQNITLYPLFKGSEYNIYYKYKEGTVEKTIGAEGTGTSFANKANNPDNYTEGIGTADLTNGMFGDATKPHYDFAGWYKEQACTTQITKLSRTDKNDITIWAKFTPSVYNIKYELNGGVNDTGNPSTYTFGTGVATLKNATKEGYTFDGWYDQGTGGSMIGSISQTDYDNKTLYARWTPKTASLTIDNDGATTVHTISSTTLTYDATMPTFSVLPEKTGYTFLGYYANDVQYVTADGKWKNIDGKITAGKWKSEDGLDLKAKWSENSYKIDYELDNGVNDANNPQNYTFGTCVAELKAPTKTGYTFNGWYDAQTGGSKVESISKTDYGNKKLYARWTINKYNVTFVDEDGTTVLKAATAYDYGTTASNIVKPADPTKAATAEYTYTFTGWTPEIADVGTSNAIYKATYTSTKNKYTVTWKDGDGNTLKTEELEYGTTPSYSGDTPTKASTVSTTYTFNNKWTPEIAKVTGNVTYKALFDEKTVQYNVTFVDEDGTTVLKEAKAYDYGTKAADIDKPADPTKTSTAEYTYTFAGWTPEIANVTGNATYTSKYTNTKNKYTVTWTDGDGNTLKTEELEYGTTPSYSGDTPTKASTVSTTYTFNNKWTPEIANVTGNATYTALFDEKAVPYNVTFVDEDGTTVLKEATAYDYGTKAADIQKPADPTKASTVEHTYTFAGWTPEIVDVVGDATYTATFDEKVRQYKLTFDGNGATGLNGKEGKSMGDQLCDYNVETPVKANEYIRKGYEFAGWNTQADGKGISYADKAAIKITGDTTLYAQWKLLDYSIKYVTKMGEYFDGTYPDSNPTSYTYGTAIGVGDDAATASKIADVKPNSDNYTFDGWYKDASFTGGKFAGINAEDIGDVTLYAKYIPKKFEIKYIVDGDVKKITGNPETYDYGTGIVKLADFAKDGYNFEGWYTDPAFTKKITAIDPTQSGDIKIYAKVVLKPVEKLEIPTSKTEGDVKGSKFMDLLSGVDKCTKHTIKLSWKKVEGADGYMIYGNQCNHHGHKYKYKFITKVGADTTTWTAKKLKKNKYYKYYIAAYRMVDGKEEIMTISKTVHATTLSKKYGIAQKVKVNKSIVNLAVGETFKLKAKEVNVSRKIQVHRAICFESTDTDIATVNKKGMIKAKSSGECKIYVFAQNGKFTTCKIIVE